MYSGTRFSFIIMLLLSLTLGVAKTNWPVMFILGIVQIDVYFVLFSFLIKKFKLKTPGREEVSNNGDGSKQPGVHLKENLALIT